jgi:hypothetical protein
MVVIEALVAVVHGDDPDRRRGSSTTTPTATPPTEPAATSSGHARGAAVGSGPRFSTPTPLRGGCGGHGCALGDGVAIDASGPSLVASVSTDDIGAVIESALVVGRPSRIVVSIAVAESRRRPARARPITRDLAGMEVQRLAGVGPKTLTACITWGSSRSRPRVALSRATSIPRARRHSRPAAARRGMVLATVQSIECGGFAAVDRW